MSIRHACGLVAVLLLAASCGGEEEADVVLEADAVTIAAHPNGGFLFATLDGAVADQTGAVLARLDVETDGQRGLLGLTVDDDGRVFVSYTDVTFDLVVSELILSGGELGGERIVWRGPTTTQGGSGGRITALDGTLVIGLGLLNDRDGQADPQSIVGKLIAIDPDAEPADQQPDILSGPWNNPFAFDATPGGDVWVADNHPRDGEERLARGDLGLDPETALVLPPDSAPAGLAATADSLYVCSYNDLELNRYELVDGTPTFAETVADDCLLDVEVLAGGDLVYSTGSTIVRLRPPG